MYTLPLLKKCCVYISNHSGKLGALAKEIETIAEIPRDNSIRWWDQLFAWLPSGSTAQGIIITVVGILILGVFISCFPTCISGIQELLTWPQNNQHVLLGHRRNMNSMVF